MLLNLKTSRTRLLAGLAVIALLFVGINNLGAASTNVTYQCYGPGANGFARSGPQLSYPVIPSARCFTGDIVKAWPTTDVTPTTATTTTTTIPATTTTTVPATTTTTQPGSCVGTAMTNGQTDINNAPTNTTFCLSGTHNWSLTPKAGQKFIGPAILDGANSTAHAFTATAPNVVLDTLTIQHYQNGNGSQDAAIHVDDSDSVKTAASGWTLRNLNVGFNSASGSGTGNGWLFSGGRFHDNRQEGIGGSMGNNVTVNGTEIDHNDFTDTTYTTRNWSCGDEAGGIKWVTNDMVIKNAFVHHNACKGIWSDLDAKRPIIDHNTVSDNWDEGIFIEISPSATVTYNTVNRNGLKNYNQSNSCTRDFAWSGGITISTSGKIASETGAVDVGNNTLSGNCQGITGVDSSRNEGPCPCELFNVTVHDNIISGTGQTGSWEDGNGNNLADLNLVYLRNTFNSPASFCNLNC